MMHLILQVVYGMQIKLDFHLQLLLDVFWRGEDQRQSMKLQEALEENMSQYLAVVQQMEADCHLIFYIKV